MTDRDQHIATLVERGLLARNDTVEIEIPNEIAEPTLMIRELLGLLPREMRLGFLAGSLGVAIRDCWSEKDHDALMRVVVETIRTKLTGAMVPLWNR
jgi:hypothetical protein